MALLVSDAVRQLADNQAALSGVGSSFTGGGTSFNQQQIDESRRQFDTIFNQRKSVLDQIMGSGILGNIAGGSSGSGGSGGGLPGFGHHQGGGGMPSLLEQLSGYGSGERARINDDFRNLSGTATARLESRGFGGSSLLPAALSGVERERQMALGDLGDRVTGEKIGVQERAADRGIDLISALSSLLGGF